MILMLVTGVLFVYILGTYFSWFILSAICAIPPAFILLLMPLMPETPRYLVSKGDPEGALKSLLWLRGATHENQVRKELDGVRLESIFQYSRL
jgi:MFS family permease